MDSSLQYMVVEIDIPEVIKDRKEIGQICIERLYGPFDSMKEAEEFKTKKEKEWEDQEPDFHEDYGHMFVVKEVTKSQ